MVIIILIIIIVIITRITMIIKLKNTNKKAMMKCMFSVGIDLYYDYLTGYSINSKCIPLFIKQYSKHFK